MNQSAFPWMVDDGKTVTGNKGMTLRDYFAAKAMQGAIAHGLFNADKANVGYAEYVAHIAYVYADAMLKAREA
jgi:hypothetical protein